MIFSFLKPKNPRPTVELSLRNDQINKVWCRNLDTFNKPELVDAIMPLKKLLPKVNIKYSDNTDRNLKILFESFRVGDVNELSKPELILLLASFTSDFNNIFNIARAVEPEMITAWLKLISSNRISYLEIARILGRNPFVSRNSGWRYNFINEALLFPAASAVINGDYYWSKSPKPEELEFYLPQMVREPATRLLLGDEALEPRFLDAIPEDAGNLVIENFEANMPADLAFLGALNSTSPLCGSTDSVQQTRLNTLEKKFNTAEFPEYGTAGIPGRVRLLGTAYIMLLLHNRRHDNAYDPCEAGKFARYVALQMPHDLTGPAFQSFLPAFKGFNKIWSGDNRSNLIGRQIWELIKPADNSDRWLDMSNFMLRYRCSDKMLSESAAFTGLFSPSSFSKHTLRREADGLDSYSRSSGVNLWDELTKPFLSAYLRMLCATGIIELAVDNSAEGLRDLSGIRYLRVTQLGRYAFNLTDEYEETVSTEPITAFDIDDENMIVTILDENSPYEPFLAKIGRRIGANRFRVTPQSIISASTDKADAQFNIGNFRRAVCPEPKGVWKNMIDEAKRRCNCQLHSNESYVLVELDSTIPGLIDFIVQNKEISKRVIKAEGARLLVPTDFNDRLRTLARNAGYLL